MGGHNKGEILEVVALDWPKVVELRSKYNPKRVASNIRHSPYGSLGRRWTCYKIKGFSCVTCGKTATHIIVWAELTKSNKDGRCRRTKGFHVDAFIKDHNLLLTVDHIIPRSKGGENNQKNLQPMCEKCNGTKGDKIPDV